MSRAVGSTRVWYKLIVPADCAPLTLPATMYRASGEKRRPFREVFEKNL